MASEQTGHVDLVALLHWALEACRLAGSIIREVRQIGNLNVLEKGDGSDVMPDPQTEADRRAEALIVAALTEKFPTVRVVGEEGTVGGNCSADWENLRSEFRASDAINGASDVVATEDVTVWVDPLDGTNDFVNMRLECVTSLIGISVNKFPVAGVIYRPFSDEAVFGSRDYGLFHFRGATHETSAMLRTIGNLDAATPRLVTSKTRTNSRTDELIGKMGNFQVNKMGGAGWKFWQLLKGDAEIYFYPKGGMKLWDICAGDALLRVLGGHLTAPSGSHFVYDDEHLVLQEGLIATTPALDHDCLVHTIRQYM